MKYEACNQRFVALNPVNRKKDPTPWRVRGWGKGRKATLFLLWSPKRDRILPTINSIAASYHNSYWARSWSVIIFVNLPSSLAALQCFNVIFRKMNTSNKVSLFIWKWNVNKSVHLQSFLSIVFWLQIKSTFPCISIPNRIIPWLLIHNSTFASQSSHICFKCKL